MKSSQFDCFSNGGLNFVPANWSISIMILKYLRRSSGGSSHEQGKKQDNKTKKGNKERNERESHSNCVQWRKITKGIEKVESNGWIWRWKINMTFILSTILDENQKILREREKFEVGLWGILESMKFCVRCEWNWEQVNQIEKKRKREKGVYIILIEGEAMWIDGRWERREKKENPWVWFYQNAHFTVNDDYSMLNSNGRYNCSFSNWGYFFIIFISFKNRFLGKYIYNSLKRTYKIKKVTMHKHVFKIPINLNGKFSNLLIIFSNLD